MEYLYQFMPVAIFLNAALLAFSLRVATAPAKEKRDR